MTIASVSIVDKLSNEKELRSDADPDNLIKQLVDRYRGKIVHYSNHFFLTTFEGPSKAVHCGIDMQDAIKSMDARLAIGIHIGECLVYSDQEISGEAIDVLKDVQARVQPDQIVVTQTVKNLLSGAGLNFVHWGSLLNAATGQRLPLLSVKDRLREDMETGSIDFYALSKNDSFLENVLQSIENHLSSEQFGVENLCRDIGISERQLQRKLKLIANKSPNQMIRSVRLHRAKELILSKDRGIAEAAFDTGFSNPSYFSKCFKEEFGILPSALWS
ncbi:MAG: helix-turn-helix domain-containing protein [Saprospiraceae bacterium]|nr:helix-turn-helix domain-containing protein [Saprospiraceae bacterium]